MQQLFQETNTARLRKCGTLVLDATPPVLWFIRRKMRTHRKSLSIPQFRSLCWIASHPSCTLSCVAEHLGSSLPTASRVIGGLVGKGLIRRTGCDKDRRQISLVATRRGHAVLAAAWAATRTEMAAELSGLTEDQCSIVIQAMEILKSKFGSMGVPTETKNTTQEG